MQKQITQYFNTDRSWEAGVKLYHQLPNRMQSFCKSLTRMSGTPKDLEYLHYELWKHTNKPPRLLDRVLNASLKNIIDTDPTPVIPINALDVPDNILKLTGSQANNQQPMDEATALHNELWKHTNTPPLLLNVILDKTDGVDHTTLSTEAKQEIIKKEINQASHLEKASLKIRVQFPFLTREDCPNNYKILVGDLVTAYENYKATRLTLFANTTNEDWATLARDVVTKYELRKDIFAELEHFQKTGEVLGKHPLFVRESLKEELANQTAAYLGKRKDTLERNIRRNDKLIQTQKGNKFEATTKRLEQQKWELGFVTELLKNR